MQGAGRQGQKVESYGPFGGTLSSKNQVAEKGGILEVDD